MITFTCPSCGHVETVTVYVDGKPIPTTTAGNRLADEPPHPATAPQTASAPQCSLHGLMIHKAGTNKSGTPYSGFFCTIRDCPTKPVWDPK